MTTSIAVPTPPSQVWIAPGQCRSLRSERGCGGEGRIYDCCSGLAKIYRPSVLQSVHLRTEVREKVDLLIRMVDLQRDLRVGAPSLHLYADEACREWTGFLMRRCPGVTLYALGSLDGIAKSLPGWDRWNITRAAAALVSVLASLEARGVVVADINPGNFLVDPASGRISCIDVDSYQIRTAHRVYPSKVFTPRYACLEVLDAPAARAIKPEEYRFAVSVLLFELLTHGLHPYSVFGGDDPVENIRAGRTFIGGRRASGAVPGELFDRYNTLNPAIKHLCVRAFVDGHANPGVRPTFADWQWALREQVEALEATAA